MTDVACYTSPRLESVKCSDEVFTDTICKHSLITFDDDGDARYTNSLWVIDPGFTVLKGFGF